MPVCTELHFRRAGESIACYLLSGCLTLCEEADGKVVDVSWPGELTGTFIGVARAATASVFLEVPEYLLLRGMTESRELTAWVWQQQQQRMGDLARRIRLNQCTVEQRILHTIIELDQRAKDRVIPLAQKEVAELAGATRETASTFLNRLQREGLVSLGRRRVVIESRDRLRKLLLPLGTSRVGPQPPAGAAA